MGQALGVISLWFRFLQRECFTLFICIFFAIFLVVISFHFCVCGVIKCVCVYIQCVFAFFIAKCVDFEEHAADFCPHNAKREGMRMTEQSDKCAKTVEHHPCCQHLLFKSHNIQNRQNLYTYFCQN